jgi:Family of unknown function (DUF5719)
MTSRTSGGRRGHRQTLPDSAVRGVWRVMPLVVLLVAAGLIGWSTTRDAESAPSPPRSTELPLSSTDLTCPAVGATELSADKAGIGFTSLSRAARASAAEDAVQVTPLPKGKPLAISRPTPGRWQVVRQPADESEPLLVSVSGALAAGASAYAATTATDEAGAGLAVAECVRPSREAWFVGAGSTVDHASTLLLSNPATTDAIVDVTLLTADGGVEPEVTAGIVVRPREVVRLVLSDVAAGEGETVVQVAATQGQVGAAVLDNWASTLDPAGTEWIPAAQPPATSSTVSPLIADSARQELIVGNPNDRSATVDIQVIGADGTAPVQDFETVTVGAGAVEVLRVPDLLEDQTAMLQLDADLPVVASLRSISSGSPVDLAYGTTVPELADPAVVPVDLPTVDPSGLSLAVAGASADSEAAFSVEAYDADGSSLAEVALTVGPGSTQTWEAGRRKDLDVDPADIAYLVVTPTEGTLRASAVYVADDSARSSLPLRGAPSVIDAPGVYPLE